MDFIDKTYLFNKLGETPIDDSAENLEAAINIFLSEVQELMDNFEQYKLASKIDNSKRKEVLKGLLLDDINDLKITADGIGYRLGFDKDVLKSAEHVVADANLSKFPKTLDEASDSVVKYANDDRYENVSFKQVDENHFVVYGNVSGTKHYKILKSINFQDPQEKLDKLIGIVVD